MMFGYVNLLAEFVIMFSSVLYHKDNYYTFILSSYVFIGGGGGRYIYIYIYIYIYWYNSFVILSCCYVLLLPCRNIYVYILYDNIIYSETITMIDDTRVCRLR